MSNHTVNQAARLALFNSPTGYEEKHIGDKWYVKHFNGITGKWQVAVYSEDSFRRYKTYSKPKSQPVSSEPWICTNCNHKLGYGSDVPMHTSATCPSTSRSMVAL